MKQKLDTQTVQKFFIERGVWVRPFGKLIYSMPAFLMDDGDIETITATMIEYARSVSD